MDFIYAFSEEDKKQLLLANFKYICECKMGDKPAFVFREDCTRLNFNLDKSKYLVTNKMYF